MHLKLNQFKGCKIFLNRNLKLLECQQIERQCKPFLNYLVKFRKI